MKTILRKKGWPKWAKYYAVDHYYGTWVYSKEPSNIPCTDAWWFYNCVGKMKIVRGHLAEDCKTWCDSLRRIVEAKE